jgi:hypothetical protein
MAIAQADGKISQFFPAVKTPASIFLKGTPASIVVDRLENSTEVDETVGIPHE